MFELLHQDMRLVAVAKPSGLAVHRSARVPERDTCMRRLRDQLGRWVYPVHRLDRGTSGVLAFALDPAAAQAVTAAFARRQVNKTYLAVVRGFAPDAGAIDHPIGDADGGAPAPAFTRFACLARVELPYAVGRYASARYSLVRAEPLTGREHQIRRHLRHIDHPVVGDVTHGDSRHNRFFRARFGLHRLLLHALHLRLPHPDDGRPLALHAPLPPELRALFDELGWLAALDTAEAA